MGLFRAENLFRLVVAARGFEVARAFRRCDKAEIITLCYHSSSKFQFFAPNHTWTILLVCAYSRRIFSYDYDFTLTNQLDTDQFRSQAFGCPDVAGASASCFGPNILRFDADIVCLIAPSNSPSQAKNGRARRRAQPSWPGRCASLRNCMWSVLVESAFLSFTARCGLGEVTSVTRIVANVRFELTQ